MVRRIEEGGREKRRREGGRGLKGDSRLRGGRVDEVSNGERKEMNQWMEQTKGQITKQMNKQMK